MSRETKNKQIGGFEYTCTQFPPQKALRVLTKLTKYLGAPLAKLMQNTDSKKSMLEQEIDSLDIGGAILSLGASLGDDDLYVLAKDICESVVLGMKDNTPGALSGQLNEKIFDAHFMGGDGLKRLFQVMIFAIEVNYSDFLGDIVAKASSVRAAV